RGSTGIQPDLVELLFYEQRLPQAGLKRFIMRLMLPQDKQKSYTPPDVIDRAPHSTSTVAHLEKKAESN
ncbi:MAG: hypothetical protein GY822_23915, partial [Deltaproteobacteria bacterium]|nr:hypothetical protein [Deltaproteobacteria bacterium]